MKVICIDAAERPGFIPVISPSDWDIVEGNVYTVIDEFTADDGTRCVSLLEDPDRDEWGYFADRFIPLSTIDETEMERSYKTETV